jgi:hypothetical protein
MAMATGIITQVVVEKSSLSSAILILLSVIIGYLNSDIQKLASQDSNSIQENGKNSLNHYSIRVLPKDA